MSFLSIFESFIRLKKSMIIKQIQTKNNLNIVKLTGLSSFKPILINGKANAQKIIGSPIIKEIYFLFFLSKKLLAFSTTTLILI